MVKRRSTEAIMANLLTIAIDGGVKKTHMVYRGNLNFAVIRQYIKLAMNKKFLEFVPESKTYSTTEKGKEFVKAYNNVAAFMVEEAQIFG